MPKIRRKSIENDFLLIFFLHAERGCRSIIYFNDFATPSVYILTPSLCSMGAFCSRQDLICASRQPVVSHYRIGLIACYESFTVNLLLNRDKAELTNQFL